MTCPSPLIDPADPGKMGYRTVTNPGDEVWLEVGDAILLIKHEPDGVVIVDVYVNGRNDSPVSTMTVRSAEYYE